MPTRRTYAILAAAVLVVGIAGSALAPRFLSGGDPFADCRSTAIAGGTAAIGGPFTLTGTDGQPVTDAAAITGPTLVYFGYTFCPDVCPMDVSRNADAAETLAGRGIDVGQIFISIDPARDTPEVVGDFTGAIDPKIVGLTGSPEAVDAAAKAYRVYYKKNGDDPDTYLMDHSSFTYLMAPGVGFLEFYPSATTADAMAASVQCFAGHL